MKIIVIVWLCCLTQVSLSQDLYEFPQPGLDNCYCIDTYKTDFGPGDELVRSERSFLKKLFKNWGKWFHDDCVQCCQNNADYSGSTAGNGDVKTNSYDYSNDYNNNYQSLFRPPDIPEGSHGHIYLPIPHPHRIMTHLHGYFNRPYRRGGSSSANTYPPKEAYVEEKPVVAVVEEPAAVYEEPVVVQVQVEEVKPDYTEKDDQSSEESTEKKDDYDSKSDYKEEKKDDYDSKSDYKAEKKDEKPYAVQTPVTTQIIQPIVPIVAPPMYIYQPQYYSPQPVSYGSLYQAPAPMSYAQSYSPPAAPSYSPPAAPSYSPPVAPAYSPPAAPSYSPPAAPSNSPPAAPSYSPPAAPSYSPPTYSPPSLPYSSLESYGPPSCPSNCGLSPNYFKRTYSTSMTYLLPPSYSSYEHDQPMRSCPELFTSYGSSAAPSLPY